MVVDDDAPPEITGHKWFAHERGSVRGATRRGKMYAGRFADGGGPMISAHRIILGAQPGQFVDHINGCTLDNRRNNLRIATAEENGRNQITVRMRQGFRKGVQKAGKRWRARIVLSGKIRHLGVFDTEDDAAREYDRAAREHFGEFAALNFPEKAAE